LYLGWLPLLFSFFAFKQWKKNRLKAAKQDQINTKDDFMVGFFIFSAVLAFIFSLPPYINLGIFKIYLPSFFMYKVFSMFRAYARFGVIVMLSISVLAGIGISYILQYFTSIKAKSIFVIFTIAVIIFEFANIPPLRATDISDPPKVYKWLAQQEGDFAIAEYPLGQANLGEGYIPLDYLFWQRVHKKKLINGALIGTDAYKVKQKIYKVSDKNTAAYLAWLGAKYVIVHLDIYEKGTDRKAVDVIGSIPDLRGRSGFKLVEKFKNVEIYELIAKPIKPAI
jgi:hypothetical protein